MSYAHVWSRSVWLLVCPAVLSYDWQMGSIALVTRLNDHRNIFSAALLLSAGALLLHVIRHRRRISCPVRRAPASAAAAADWQHYAKCRAISLLMPPGIRSSFTVSR